MTFKMYVKHAFQFNQELREILTVCSRWWIVIDYEGFVHIYIFFCVLKSKKNRTGSDLMLNISLSVCQS